MPPGFSWVDEPLLAALAFPDSSEDIAWLRRHGIEVLVSLTETPVARPWVNDAGIMLVHVPVTDMNAPSERQLEKILDTIRQANAANLGVAVHCAAGRGRTGTVLAAYFTTKGLSGHDAIAKVRTLRPGSIETPEQEAAVLSYALRNRNS